jgi:hypothetical protein
MYPPRGLLNPNDDYFFLLFLLLPEACELTETLSASFYFY